MLKQKIQDDLKQAMLAREELKTSVLRMVKSAIQYYEIQKGGAGYEATDEDVMAVLNRELKNRKDSIDLYKKGGRKELAEKEENEVSILKVYLPEQMSDIEIKSIVKETVAEAGAKGFQDMGKVMSLLMPKLKGRADGNLVSNFVREELSK